MTKLPIFQSPEQNEQLARDAQAIVDASGVVVTPETAPYFYPTVAHSFNCDFRAEGATFMCNGGENPVTYVLRGMCVDLSGWTCTAPGATPQVVADERDSDEYREFRQRGYTGEAIRPSANALQVRAWCEGLLAREPKPWLPSPENINALPAPIKAYIHDITAIGDYNHIVHANTFLKDQCDGLQRELVKARSALATAPVQPVAVPDGWRIVKKATHYALISGNTVVASLAGPEAEENAAILARILAAPAAQGDAEPDMFLRGVIAALGALAPHSQHGDVLHDEIVQSVGKDELYRAAELEDVVWAGLDPKFYAAIAAKAAS